MNHLDLSPPHSIEAEQGVLGGLMLDNEAWDLVGDQLQEENFYRREHKLIFKAISDLASKNSPARKACRSALRPTCWAARSSTTESATC